MNTPFEGCWPSAQLASTEECSAYPVVWAHWTAAEPWGPRQQTRVSAVVGSVHRFATRTIACAPLLMSSSDSRSNWRWVSSRRHRGIVPTCLELQAEGWVWMTCSELAVEQSALLASRPASRLPLVCLCTVCRRTCLRDLADIADTAVAADARPEARIGMVDQAQLARFRSPGIHPYKSTSASCSRPDCQCIIRFELKELHLCRPSVAMNKAEKEIQVDRTTIDHRRSQRFCPLQVHLPEICPKRLLFEGYRLRFKIHRRPRLCLLRC